jgi:hypothetical protein
MIAAGADATIAPDVFRVFIRRIGFLDSTAVLDSDLGLQRRIDDLYRQLLAWLPPPPRPPRAEMLAAAVAAASQRSQLSAEFGAPHRRSRRIRNFGGSSATTRNPSRSYSPRARFKWSTCSSTAAAPDRRAPQQLPHQCCTHATVLPARTDLDPGDVERVAGPGVGLDHPRQLTVDQHHLDPGRVEPVAMESPLEVVIPRPPSRLDDLAERAPVQVEQELVVSCRGSP